MIRQGWCGRGSSERAGCGGASGGGTRDVQAVAAHGAAAAAPLTGSADPFYGLDFFYFSINGGRHQTTSEKRYLT